jgi:hypothetical protein
MDPSRIGKAESVAAAVNWSAVNEALCRRKPFGVEKSSRSVSTVRRMGRFAGAMEGGEDFLIRQ